MELYTQAVKIATHLNDTIDLHLGRQMKCAKMLNVVLVVNEVDLASHVLLNHLYIQ